MEHKLKFNLNIDKIPNEELNIKDLIFDTIDNYFPKMDIFEKDFLTKIVTKITLFINYKLNIDYNDFERQLIMNNNRNIIAICNLVLPFIDDKNDFHNHKNIKSISDLIESQITTKNVEENPQKYCNFLWDHIGFTYKLEEKKNKNLLSKVDEYKFFNNLKFSSMEFLNAMLYNIIDTINSSYYKLYVNWINIFPIGIDYQNSRLYKNSFQYIESDDEVSITLDRNKLPLTWYKIGQTFDEDSKFINDYIRDYDLNFTLEEYKLASETLMFYYGGIQVEDIYNTFVNDYYFSIKKNKWLLFEYSQNSKINIFISILNEIFDISFFYKKYKWQQLVNSDQNKLNDNWNSLKKSIKNKTSFKDLSYDLVLNIFVTLISRFYSNYPSINYLIKNKNLKEITKEKLVGDEIEYNKEGLKHVDEYLEAIQLLEFEYIYDFLLISISNVLDTPYKEILFGGSSKNLNIKLPEYNGIQITPKNYYNFGKALTYENPIDNDTDIMKDRFSFLWSGLSSNQRDIVCLRFNTKSSNQDWFKITKILSRIHNYSSRKANEINTNIYNYMRSNLINLTFINLARKGVLSEFKYNPKVSDEKILTDDYFTKKNILDQNMRKESLSDKHIEYYNNYCYYFANNEKYGELDKIYDSKNPKGMLYLEHLREVNKKGDTWYTFYAMDWMCQIDFFMKFMSHRVLFITGSTGQGKSTQVPKLTLYGLKAFYYKNSGKAICTQPRIAPTVENVKSISNSMGIPIETYNEKLGENIRTLNGVVQYKYANDSHVDENQSYFLRMVTDATLLNQMKQSPTLKKLKTHEDETIIDPIITEENIYDILMVDEAHEHNANMDLILTLARNSLIYNNDLKLLIISATMDDDEPIYRSYYKYIDDNLIYPIPLNNLQYGVSKNYIDRRFHISPPGKTTQFIVKDHFTENSPDTYKDNEDLAIKKVQEIFNSTTKGDILFFSTTEKKILKICEILNKSIPKNCICLPYFAKMPKKYFEKVTNISSTIKNIIIDKIDLVDVFTGNKNEDKASKVNKDTYSRAVVIATSVAEASLTIPSLRFVVDLGYQLTPEYDYILKVSKPEEIKITDASRMQRRGRVGRVAGGDVYYMYPKDSRKYVKGKFNISTSNFSDMFISLLAFDDNKIIDKKKLIKMLTFKPINEENANQYEKIIYNQYKIKEEVSEKLIENKSEFIKFIDWLFPSFKTGLSAQNLFDLCGHFYLIHPFESRFKREPFTRNILNFNSELQEFIDYKEGVLLIETALTNLDLVNYTNKNYNISKTELCLRTDDFMQKLSIYSRSETKTLITSYILNVLNEYLFCNSFIKVTGGKIENIIDFDKIGLGKSKSYKNFFEKNKKSNSDIEFLIFIYDILDDLINFNELDNILDQAKQSQVKIIEVIQSLNLSYKEIIDQSLRYKLKVKDIDEILKLKLKGKSDVDSINEIKDENPNKELINKFIDNIPNLKQFIDHMNLNELIIKDIIYNYICDRRKYNRNMEKYTSLVNEYSSIIKIISDDLDKNLKITVSYLISNLDRINSYKNDKLYSLRINYKNDSKIYVEKTIRDYFGIPLTFVQNLSPMVLHLIDDGFGEEIKHGIFFNLDKKLLLEYVPHLILIYQNLDDNFINKSDYVKNKDIIFSKVFSKKDIEKESDEKKILSLFYSRMADKIDRYQNQKGGFINFNLNPLQKTNINTLKKIPILFDKLDEDLKKNIDKFDYAYVHIVGTLSKVQIMGIHLIKKKVEEVLYDHIIICSALNIGNSLDLVANHLHNKGFQLVFKIDMNTMLDDTQQKVLGIIFK